MGSIALISFLVNSINTRLLAAYLKKNGYEAVCFFCQQPFNELNLKELIEILKKKNVSLVGISLVTDDFYQAVTITNAIKRELGIPVIWGGSHADVRPEECLRYADMVCLGEGEDALLDLVKSLSSGSNDTNIKNIWFKNDEKIIKNELRCLEENLDKYPFPDFDLDRQYVMKAQGFEKINEGYLNNQYSIMTSRGCPYSCCYCYNSYRRKRYVGRGQYLRKKSIAKVIDELTYAKKKFPSLKKINFWDDSFVARGIEEFTEFKNQYSEKIKLDFFALIEPMAFNHEKIKLLKSCGLAELQVGIQSGSENINKKIYNRPVPNKKVIEAAKSIRELGIRATYDVIFNNPYEDCNDIKQTIKLFLKFPKPFSVQGYNLIFYPGAEITQNALKDNFIVEKQSPDDFSTIQGRGNSPLATGGNAVVSSRFYEIRYDSAEKEYFNSIIKALGLRYMPNLLISYVANSRAGYKIRILNFAVWLYLLLGKIKKTIHGLSCKCHCNKL